MMEITFANYKQILYSGARILFDGFTDIVVADETWNGGYKVSGKSILYVLENYKHVYLMDDDMLRAVRN